MHVAMHNWMRAEPIEVTIARLAQVRLRRDRDQRRARALRHQARPQAAHGPRADVLGLGHADARRPQPAGQGRGAARGVGEVRQGHHHDGQGARRPGDHDRAVARSARSSPEASPEEEWQWAVESLKQCYEHGHEGRRAAGDRAAQPLRDLFPEPPRSGAALAEAVGPECGICLDVFHMNIEEKDMFQAIRNSQGPPERLPRRRQQPHGLRHGRARLGARSSARCKEIGYDGALTVEFVAPVDRTPANPYKNALETGAGRADADELKFIDGPRQRRRCRTSSTPGWSTRRSRRCGSTCDGSVSD